MANLEDDDEGFVLGMTGQHGDQAQSALDALDAAAR